MLRLKMACDTLDSYIYISAEAENTPYYLVYMQATQKQLTFHHTLYVLILLCSAQDPELVLNASELLSSAEEL